MRAWAASRAAAEAAAEASESAAFERRRGVEFEAEFAALSSEEEQRALEAAMAHAVAADDLRGELAQAQTEVRPLLLFFSKSRLVFWFGGCA